MNIHSFRHYKTNISKIDEDHWTLFEILNEIKFNPEDCSPINLLKLYLALFIQHTQDEEELMLQNDYPFLDAHKQEHLLLRSSVESCLRRLSGTTHNSVGTKQLESQLVEHIDRRDIEFSEFYHFKIKSKP